MIEKKFYEFSCEGWKLGWVCGRLVSIFFVWRVEGGEGVGNIGLGVEFLRC